jgi:hypothetical protein
VGFHCSQQFSQEAERREIDRERERERETERDRERGLGQNMPFKVTPLGDLLSPACPHL